MTPVLAIVVGFVAVLLVYWLVRRGSGTGAKPGDGGWAGADGGTQRGKHEEATDYDASSDNGGHGGGDGGSGDGGGD